MDIPTIFLSWRKLTTSFFIVAAFIAIAFIAIFWSEETASAAIERTYTLPFYENSPITCPWGPYENCGLVGQHNGTDYSVGNNTTAGDKVAAALAGTVGLYTDFDPFNGLGCGYYVVIDHVNGHKSRYCHLTSWAVSNGQAVGRGQLIGFEGSSGATGVNLHFDARVDASPGNCCSGTSVDPYGGPYSPSTYLWSTNPPSYHLAGAVVNMLRNASGEQASIFPWSETGAADAFIWNSPSPLSGSKFVRTGGGASGGSVYQDVVTSTPNDAYYLFSLWARMSLGCSPVDLKVWGLGGSAGDESYLTHLNTLCTNWTYVSVPGDFAYAHNRVRVEVYIGANKTIDIDATELVPTKNMNASFEHPGKAGNGTPYWNKIDGTTGWSFLTSPGPKSGARFMRAQRTVPAGPSDSKIWDDIPVVPVSGESYTFSVWLRAVSPTVTGLIRIHTLGPTYEKTETWFTLNSTAWKEWSATLEPVAVGHTGLRIEIYFFNQGSYDIDGTQVVQNLLARSSFESGATPEWGAFEDIDPDPNTTTYLNVIQPVGGARDGLKHLQMSTNTPNGSVFQDIPRTALVNQSYDFVIWVRCVNICPVTGSVKLVAMPSEASITTFSASAVWTPVVATIDVSSGGFPLRAQIHMSQTGRNYDVDATGNSIGIAPSY